MVTEIESRTHWEIVPVGHTITCFDESQDPHFPENCEAHALHFQAQRDRLDLGQPQPSRTPPRCNCKNSLNLELVARDKYWLHSA
jgi:hypothetical protein